MMESTASHGGGRHSGGLTDFVTTIDIVAVTLTMTITVLALLLLFQ